jgi:type II secretory pathway component GspD/PulD (secretin)
MARKNNGRILSGGVLLICIALFCPPDTSVQAAIKGRMITYTISGSVGLSGVEMKGLPDGPVITDQNGFYSTTVDYGWKGTVTPSMEGYTFEPASRPYSKVTSDQSSQDYTAQVITFTISGKTDLDGVVMNGLPGNPITGSDGTYQATVEYGWSGTVIPTKEGYKFTPDQKPYTAIKNNQTNQNYKGVVITFAISGSAGAEGVVMKGLPGNVVSKRDGTYSATVDYGWSGTVTPTKEGYTFEPSTLEYSNLMGPQTNQMYTATISTFTISGTAGMDGVEMKGLPGAAVFTDATGYYSATVDYGWSGTVTPQKAGYTFEPATSSYSRIISNRDEQNYSPTLITLTISGSTGMEGVTMEGLPGNPVTSSGGLYSVTVDYGWSGTVLPTKEGYKFTPDQKIYPPVTVDQKNNNYSGAIITFTITGSAGVGGVTMRGLPGNPVTRNDGTYSATVNYNWSGKVTPIKEGYTFEPSEMEYANIIAPEISQTYMATLLKRAISGTILSDKGEPVENVLIIADAGGGSTTTNANGEYELLVDHGWRGKVTPAKEGYTFKPTQKPYSAPVSRDLPKQSYSAILKTFTISNVVMVGSTPIEGVSVSANNGGSSDTTNAQGRFTVTVPYGWSGEIMWTKEGFLFDPPSESYTDVRENILRGVPEVTRPPTTIIEPELPERRIEPGLPERIIEPGAPQIIRREPEQIPPTPPIEEPKTDLERNILKIQQTLADLLAQQAEAPTGEPNAPLGPQEPLITNTFLDNDLTEVLQDIASTAGIPIIPDETVVGIVTAELDNVPLDTALDIVLAGTPYVVKKTPYYYLVASAGLTDSKFPVISETRRVRMNYITAEAAVGLLSTAFKPYVQAEVGLPGTSTYTVCVTAPPALADRIVEDLKQIDIVPSHVLLDARIVVMERGDLLNLGVEWNWPTISAGTFSTDFLGRGDAGTPDYGGRWPFGIQIGYTPDADFTDSLQMALNLLSINGEATILAKPQVMAQDGKVAEINVMTEEYYMLSVPGSELFFTRSELQQIDSGTKLNIIPHIGDNNDITLEMAIEVSDSIPRGRGSDLPVVTRRTATNTVRIKDGGTVAVAGLSENKTRLEKRRTPGLSRIPIIGNLFKNSNDEKSTREIAVFVTANIIPESEQSDEFAQPAAPVRAPIRPVEDEFKMQLRQSLSRPSR